MKREWAVVISRYVAGIGREYLAEDRHDDRGKPYWVHRQDDPFVLRFWELSVAEEAAQAYPGSQLECVRVV